MIKKAIQEPLQLLEPTLAALNERILLEYYVVCSDPVVLESQSRGCLVITIVPQNWARDEVIANYGKIHRC